MTYVSPYNDPVVVTGHVTQHELARLHPGAAGAAQLGAHDFEAAILGRAQGAHQGQERGLAGTGGPCENHDFPGFYFRADIFQDLLAQHAAAVGVFQLAD